MRQQLSPGFQPWPVTLCRSPSSGRSPPARPPACLQLIEGVTLVASALPDGQRQQCVQQMLDIVVQPMQGILQAAAAEPGGSGPGTPTAAGGGAAPTPPAATPGSQLALVLPLMERVTTVFRAVKDPADVAEALVRLWPWIEAALGARDSACGHRRAPLGWRRQLAAGASSQAQYALPTRRHRRCCADRFAGDAPAIERICRAPRYAVRSAGKAAAPAVPLLVASLPQRFESSRQPCFLYVASELIKTFGDEPARDLELGEDRRAGRVAGRVGASGGQRLGFQLGVGRGSLALM